MPTDRPLSEQVQELADLTWRQHGCAAKGSRQEEVLREDAKILSEAARLLALFKQPEVAELLQNAQWLRAHPREYMTEACMGHWADNLEAHAHALVELAEAQARLARVEGLPMGWHAVLDSQVAGERLAALVEGLRKRIADTRLMLPEYGLLMGAAVGGVLSGIEDDLAAHGFAPESEVPREAAQEAADGVSSTEAGKGSLGA